MDRAVRRWLAIAAAFAFAVVAGAEAIGPGLPAVAGVVHGTVFRQNSDGYACTRVPAIVRTRAGTLLAFAEGRKGSCADNAETAIVLKRSADDGATWSALQVVDRGDDSTRHNPVPIVDVATGRIVLVFTQDYTTAWVRHSDNDGVDWSERREIPALPDWKKLITGPSHGIQLARGPHAGRLVAGASYRTHADLKGGAILYSDDVGTTWSLGAHDHSAAPGLQVQELSVFERPDGGLYAAARNEQGTSPAQMAYAMSADAGESFIAPFAAIDDLVVPTVQASTLAIRATDTGSPYDRVLIAAPSHPAERRLMTIRSSFDGGRTWQTTVQGKVLYAERAAYSDMVSLGGNRFGVLYEGGTDYTYASIRFTRFTEADLDQPEDATSLTRTQDSATLLTTDPSQRHVFAVSSTGQLGHWFEEPTWEVKRGTWASGVAGEVVAFLYAGNQHVFVRGQLGELEHRWWDPAARAVRAQTWAPAGSLAGSPTGFATATAMHTLARGSDGSLRHWWLDDTLKAQTWAPAGTLAGDPVAIRYGDQQHVWAAGANGQLLHWWWQPGAPVRQESWGGSATGGVTAFVHNGQLHAFGRDSTDHLAHWFWDPGTQVVVRQVWGGGVALNGRPISFVHNRQQHVFARDANNALAHWWWDPGYPAPRHAIWPGALHSDPMALVVGGQQHVYGAAADGQLTHWWWDPSTGVQRQNWGGDVATG